MPQRVPTAATKGAELIKRLNSIALGGEVDDLVLRRIDLEARRMMTADPVEANTVLGAVASLEGRADDVQKHFEIALQQSGNSAEVYCNYSSALQNLGETFESFEMAKQAIQHAPDDPDVLRYVIAAALQAAHFREASAFRDHLGKLTPDRPQPDELVASNLGDAVDRGVFREESVREVLQVVHEILKAERIQNTGYSTLVAEAGCPDSFLYKIPVFASPDRAADLNETLANRLVSQPDLMIDPGTKFVPMFIGIRVDGGNTERVV